MAKKIVVLPGSEWQIPIIKKSKAKGYKTFVINPYEESPAFKYADGYLQSDIFDVERVVKYCEDIKADAVISEECDIAMPLLAELGERLCLPALDRESARLFTDKYEMREFSRRNGLHVPEYRMCRTLEETVDFFEFINSKIIIKPLDSNSSRGVFTIESTEDIRRHFEETLSFSKVRNAILAEQYIEGTEFTVDGIKTPDRHCTLAISQKKHYAYNSNIACELYFTHDSELYDYQELTVENDLFVNKSSLQFGLTHAEYKFQNGRYYLIEIAARGGGNLISSHIVPFMSGVDNYDYLLECALGNITSPEFEVNKNLRERCAVLRFFDPPAERGIVEKIDGLDILRNNPDILAYGFNIKAGTYIENAQNDAERAGFYIAGCEKKSELDQLIKDIDNNVKIVCRQEIKI